MSPDRPSPAPEKRGGLLRNGWATEHERFDPKKEDDDEPNHGIFGVSPKFPDETSHEGMEGADSEHLRQVFDHSAAPDGFAASRMTCREEAITLSTLATSDILQTLLTPCSAEKISNMALSKKRLPQIGVSYGIL